MYKHTHKLTLIRLHPAITGFTLIETMVTIAVLAILVTLATPSFTTALRNNQVSTVANTLVSALTLARSEASKQGIPVTVCAANTTQTDCAANPTWNAGWIVFTDDDATGAVNALDNMDVLIRAYAPPATGFVIGVTPNTLDHIRIRSTGMPDSGIFESSLTVVPPSCIGVKARRVTIANTGRISTTPITC